ncbi:MAG: hypothetical protein HeimC2_33580 [Candidatus Heimdallarchaeota archaeon LC_2]|nr:MAG: hypothetical protein HeimC2_33580 [Candidatus Heimdallarchaeota archaeon LC_2]
MANDKFEEEIKSKLEYLGIITTRNMFGTMAFAQDGVYFASISKGKLYLKVNEISIIDFESYNMRAFTTRGKSLNYFEIPLEILGDEDLFQKWTNRALKAAIDKNKK